MVCLDEEKMNLQYKKAIAKYLNERCKTDNCLALACMKDNKSLDGVLAYIKSEAEKIKEDQVACVPDETVYSWCVHYILEDSLSEKFEPKVKEKKTKTDIKTKETVVSAPTIAQEIKDPQLSLDFGEY